MLFWTFYQMKNVLLYPGAHEMEGYTLFKCSFDY